MRHMSTHPEGNHPFFIPGYPKAEEELRHMLSPGIAVAHTESTWDILPPFQSDILISQGDIDPIPYIHTGGRIDIPRLPGTYNVTKGTNGRVEIIQYTTSMSANDERFYELRDLSEVKTIAYEDGKIAEVQSTMSFADQGVLRSVRMATRIIYPDDESRAFILCAFRNQNYELQIEGWMAQLYPGYPLLPLLDEDMIDDMPVLVHLPGREHTETIIRHSSYRFISRHGSNEYVFKFREEIPGTMNVKKSQITVSIDDSLVFSVT